MGASPKFLIIGAQKSGTTFFYNLLCRHPFIQRATRKEIHYFSRYFDRGAKWYESHFPKPERIGILRKTITGEASPDYLFHPLAAQRAASTVPRSRLIVLLRNPVDRAFSHYHHQVRMGNETLSSFEAALEAERERVPCGQDRLSGKAYENPDYRRFSYVSRGVYVDQLMRWHEHFDPTRVLVLGAEEVFRNPQDAYRQTVNFLGLPQRDLAIYHRKRPTKYSYNPMRRETRRQLEAYFEPHNRRLYEYLGRDFGW